ncbi:MAG: dynein light chain Tctex-type family protein [archaeon]|nr:dynein light chain Tctex-type family protein [archaeon]
MSQELKFSDYKDEIQKKVDPIIKKYLDGKAYNQKDAQGWTNSISDEVIKTLHADQKGFKYICNATIFQKGDASLHFSSTCLWNPNTDGSITVKFETENMHCFVCLFAIAP